MIKPFFDYLATALTLTKKSTWHMGHIPANAPDNCTGLLNRVPTGVDNDTPEEQTFRFQFLTRNTSYVDGNTEAWRIFRIVKDLAGVQLTGYYLHDVTGTGPAYIGLDEKDRHMFSANVTVAAEQE